MHITLKKFVETGCPTRADVVDRLDFWAGRYGFQRTADDGDDLVYARGSHWHALYTFDIRKVPTEVRIRVGRDPLATCACTMSCGSWLQMSTPGDEKRLSEEMDLLEACLKGAFTEPTMPANTASVQQPERTSNSHDIQAGSSLQRKS